MDIGFWIIATLFIIVPLMFGLWEIPLAFVIIMALFINWSKSIGSKK